MQSPGSPEPCPWWPASPWVTLSLRLGWEVTGGGGAEGRHVGRQPAACAPCVSITLMVLPAPRGGQVPPWQRPVHQPHPARRIHRSPRIRRDTRKPQVAWLHRGPCRFCMGSGLGFLGGGTAGRVCSPGEGGNLSQVAGQVAGRQGHGPLSPGKGRAPGSFPARPRGCPDGTDLHPPGPFWSQCFLPPTPVAPSWGSGAGTEEAWQGSTTEGAWGHHEVWSHDPHLCGGVCRGHADAPRRRKGALGPARGSPWSGGQGGAVRAGPSPCSSSGAGVSMSPSSPSLVLHISQVTPRLCTPGPSLRQREPRAVAGTTQGTSPLARPPGRWRGPAPHTLPACRSRLGTGSPWGPGGRPRPRPQRDGARGLPSFPLCQAALRTKAAKYKQQFEEGRGLIQMQGGLFPQRKAASEGGAPSRTWKKPVTETARCTWPFLGAG